MKMIRNGFEWPEVGQCLSLRGCEHSTSSSKKMEVKHILMNNDKIFQSTPGTSRLMLEENLLETYSI